MGPFDPYINGFRSKPQSPTGYRKPRQAHDVAVMGEPVK